ncbi:hypothetical protein VTI74DRAFT_6589 [Chaetomium olivicolor]
MAFAKKPYKPKGKSVLNETAIFPSLQEDVVNALSDKSIFPEPWFNHAGGDDEAIEHYSTHVMGRFECRDPKCSKHRWSSRKIGITIRRFPGNGYNAVVYKQRCKLCEKLGVLRLDENSYVERVAYRLKKWAGIRMDQPEFNGQKHGPPHESHLCEACKRGVYGTTTNWW